jgi:hypothetical protein
MAQPDSPASVQPARAKRWWRRVDAVYLATGYLIAAVAALLVARALADGLDFLGVGWILVLVLIPLIPWLLPLLEEVAPRIRSFSLAGVQIELKDTQNAPMTLPSAGNFVGLPNDMSAFSTSTSITSLISALREQGGGPAAVIDLRNGDKWLYRNAYFLAYLLEADEQVRELVFTETRAGSDGFLVGTASPAGFRLKIAQAIPAYASATLSAPLTAFESFTNALNTTAGTASALELEAVHGYISSASLLQLTGAALSRASVEEAGGSLTEENIRTVLGFRDPYVPTTVDGQLTGLLDRDLVALSVARAVIAHH